MTRMRFSGGIVRTVEKEVSPTDAGGVWELNDVSQRLGSDDYPVNEPVPPTTTGRTATGALTDGSTVVLNDDGTVSVVAGTTITDGVGTKETFATNTTTYISSVSIPGTNKIVVAHALLGYGSAVVGTVSGNTITFGSSVVFNANSTTNINCVWDASEDRLVIDYEDQGNSSYGTAIVGSVSGDVITFGSKTIYSSSAITANKIGYDATNEKVVIVYTQTGPYSARGIVGVVSGTSITFGTSTEFWGDYALSYSVTFDPDSDVMLVVYRDANTDYGKSVVATVSGSSISFGSIDNFHLGSTNNISSTFDPVAKKHVVAYKDNGGGQNGNVVLGQVTGNTVSFSSNIVFHNADISTPALCFDPDAGKVLIAYLDLSTYEGRVMAGEVSGNSMTFESYARFSNGQAYYNSITNQSGMNIISFQDYVSSSYGASIAYTSGYESTNLTATNYLGISDGAYADGEEATIQIEGAVDDAQSGLTVTEDYFVQADGSIALTPDTPSVLAGCAVGPNNLLIKKSYEDGVTELEDLVASGELSDGSMVVLNTDGTVSAVAESPASSSLTDLTGVAPQSYERSSVYDPVSKRIVSMTLEANKVVATVSKITNGVVSTGTPVIVESGTVYSIPTITFNPTSGKVVVLYHMRTASSGANDMPHVVVGTVSGDTISFGAKTNFDVTSKNTYQYSSITSDPSSNKVVMVYQGITSANNGYYGYAAVGTISGDSISVGSVVEFDNGLNVQYMSSIVDPISGKVLLVHVSDSSSYYRVGTISGTSISFGSRSSLDSVVLTDYASMVYDPISESIVIAYRSRSASTGQANDSRIKYISFDSSGNATLNKTGNGTSIDVIGARGGSIDYDQISEKMVVTYSLSSPDRIRLRAVTINTTSNIPELETPEEISITSFYGASYVMYIPDLGKSYFSYGDNSVSKSALFQPDRIVTNLTATNFLGVSDGAYTTGQIPNIQGKGETDDAQSGLTPGQDYYIQGDGSLSTTPGTPSVLAGGAIGLTKLLVKEPVGAETPLERVASGALSDGSMVVLNSDGTVSVVTETVVPGEQIPAGTGTPVTYTQGQGNYFASTYDSIQDKVIVFYSDVYVGEAGKAVVGTVTGDSISFGTPSTFEASSTSYVSCAYDSFAEKVVVFYRNASGDGIAKVGTVSGSSVTFGSGVQFYANTRWMSSTYHPVAKKILISFNNFGGSDGRMKVGTVSGNSISFGSDAEFTSGNCGYLSSTYDASVDRIIVTYQRNNNYGGARVVEISGTTAAFGSEQIFHSAGTSHTSVAFDPISENIVIAYTDGSNNQYGTAVVATSTSDSITSYGTPVVYYNSGQADYTVCMYDPASGQIHIHYNGYGAANYGYVSVGTVSGNSITFDTAGVFQPYSGGAVYITSTYIPSAGRTVISFRDGANSGIATSLTYSSGATLPNTFSTNLTATNFLGVSDAAYADGEIPNIQTQGEIDDAQSGLTPGLSYHVQPDGSLNTTEGTPSVFAGTAIAPNKIIVKG